MKVRRSRMQTMHISTTRCKKTLYCFRCALRHSCTYATNGKEGKRKQKKSCDSLCILIAFYTNSSFFFFSVLTSTPISPLHCFLLLCHEAQRNSTPKVERGQLAVLAESAFVSLLRYWLYASTHEQQRQEATQKKKQYRSA